MMPSFDLQSAFSCAYKSKTSPEWVQNIQMKWFRRCYITIRGALIINYGRSIWSKHLFFVTTMTVFQLHTSFVACVVFQLLIACVGLGISFWIYNSGINKNVKDLILAIVVSLYFLVSLNFRSLKFQFEKKPTGNGVQGGPLARTRSILTQLIHFPYP